METPTKKIPDSFSKESFQILPGFLVTGIVLYHLAQKIDPALPLYDFAVMIVAMFFFLVGYSLVHSFESQREDFLRIFLSNKIPNLLIPFIAAIVLFQFILWLEGHAFSWVSIVHGLSKGDTNEILPYCWYVIAALYFNLCFYFVFRYLTKTIPIGLCLLVGFTAVWVLSMIGLGFPASWYKTVLAVNVGMFWQYFEKRIFSVIQSKTVVVTSFVFLVLLINLLGVLDTRPGISFVRFVGYGLLPLAFFPLWFHVRLPHIGILSYLGTISYKIYLCHGITILFFRGKHIFLVSDAAYAGFVLAGTFLLAAVLNRFVSIVRNRKKL